MRRGRQQPRHGSARARASTYGARAHLYVAEAAADSERGSQVGDIKSIGRETEKRKKNHHLGSSFSLKKRIRDRRNQASD